MEIFQALVNSRFEEESKLPIFNSSKAHAKYLIKKIFMCAEKELIIYTGGEEVAFYSDKDIFDALINKPKLQITVILGTKKNESKFREIFKGANFHVLDESKEKVFAVDLANLIPEKDYTKIKHFIVADGKYVRIEKLHKPNDKDVFALGYAKFPFLASILKQLSELIVKDYALSASK